MRPHELLERLAADVRRMLEAGAAAGGAESIRRGAGALRGVAAQVPALARISAAVGRVSEAVPDERPRAFLDLLLLVRQARASLTATDGEGKAEPVAPSGPWATDTGAGHLYPIRAALRHATPGPHEVVRGSVRQRLVADLRLLDPLLGALGDGYTELADLVAEKALPAFGPAAAAELRKGFALEGKKADARRLVALCRADAGVGLELCRAALREGSLAVRTQALKSLAEVAAPREVEQAATAVLSGKAKKELRQAAVEALGRLGPAGPNAVPLLLAALRDKEWCVQWAAGSSLGRIGRPAVEALAGCVSDPEEMVRLRSIWTLGSIGRDAAPATPALLQAISDPDWRIARSALAALGDIGPRAGAALEAIDALLGKRAEGLEPRIRITAAVARVQIGGWAPAASAVLEAARLDRDPEIRAQWTFAQRDLGPLAKSSLNSLITALRDDVPKVRRTAAEILGRFGPGAGEAVPALTDLLRDEVGFVRRDAATALGQIGRAARDSAPALTGLLHDRDKQVRQAAGDALDAIRSGIRRRSIDDEG
jgi:HEAT repeat protein